MIVKKIGHVDRAAHCRNNCRNTPKVSGQRVTKIGYVLPENNAVGAAALQTALIDAYYQVLSNDDACEVCQEHNGGIYPVRKNEPDENLPPYHPNCKCRTIAYRLDLFTYDPVSREIALWLDIMYGSDTIMQKARKLLDFYKWTGVSMELIGGILLSIGHIGHIGRRIAAFFRQFNTATVNLELLAQITSADLVKFGWYTPTQDEADRMMAAFARFDIITRESIIQFLAIAAAESGYGRRYLEDGNDAYWESHGYNRNTRGAGYIQVTHDYNHRAFLDYMGDPYDGADTAVYIAENYPLEVSVWFWSKLNLYGYQGGVNEFIETKMAEEGDPLLIFLKTSYYIGGMPGGSFNSDINDAIAGNATFTMTDTHLIINENQYSLPSRWEDRLEAYEKAQEIW